MTLLIFIITLSIMVFVHELGHFLVAKKNGIRVEEFGLGMPPRLIGKKIGETLYSLNLLPFGGFVRLTGEEVSSSEEELIMESDPRSFAAKSPAQRTAVLVAGVFMNLVLAVSLYYVIFLNTGFKTFNLPLIFDHEFRFGQQEITSTVVSGVQQGSGAQTAGFELGEAVVSIDGQKVNNISDIRASLAGKSGQEVVVELKDMRMPVNEEIRKVSVYPQTTENGDVVLGVYLADSVKISYASPVEKIFSGFLHSYNVLSYSISGLGKLVGISVQEKDITPVSESVAGPVGIYSLVGNIIAYGGPNVVLSLMDYVALMSLSLAFINILPFPALDGGRVVFVFIEKITKRKIDPILEAKIHKIGITVLFGLLILVTIKDIGAFF